MYELKFKSSGNTELSQTASEANVTCISSLTALGGWFGMHLLKADRYSYRSVSGTYMCTMCTTGGLGGAFAPPP